MISLTDRCTGACAYCLIPARESVEMSLEEIKTIISDIAAMGCQRIGFWGGEPLLRDDVGEIIRHTRSKGIFVTIDTNGHLVPKRGEELALANHVNISLDGDREAHDSVRGEGTFALTMKGVQYCPDTGLPFWTITVLAAHNIGDIDWLLASAKELGFLTTFQVLHHNDTIGKPDGLRPEDKDLREAIGLLIARKKEGAPIASSVKYLEHALRWDDYRKNRVFLPKVSPPCVAGELYCNIDTNGRLYPCSLFVDEMDSPNVLKAGFRQAFDDLKTPKCNSCLAGCFTEYNLLYSLDIATGLNWVRALGK